MQTSTQTSEIEQLQINKLKLEIKQLSHGFFYRLSTWQNIMTVIVSFIGVWLLKINGAFDYQQKKLYYQEKNLKYDIKVLETRKEELSKRVGEFENDSIRLVKTTINLEDSLRRRNLEMNLLQTSIKTLKRDKNYEAIQFNKIKASMNAEYSRLDSISKTSNETSNSEIIKFQSLFKETLFKLRDAELEIRKMKGLEKGYKKLD